MSQSLTLKVEGLFTSPNPFSSAPDGGLLRADDLSIDQPDVATPRRGFVDWTTLPLSTDRLTRLDYYQGSTDSKGYTVGTWSNGKFGYASGTGWVPFSGTYNDPDSVMARCRFFQTSKNLYLLTSAGVYKTASIENDPPRLSGVPRGLDVQLTFNNSASQWFTWNPQGTFVGSTTNSSATLTFPGSLTLPAAAVGNYISGTNIATGTTIQSITQPAVAAQTTVTSTTVGSTTFTVASATGIATGQFVQDYAGTTFSAGTTVTNVNGTTITVSSPIRLTNASTIGVSFTNPGYFTMSNAATGTSSSVTVTYGLGAQVAYRIVWGYTDANQNLLLGAPSQWVSITNMNCINGTVTINTTIPSGITTGYFYQIYRSPQTSAGTVVPGDTMQLVYQSNPTSTDITNGYISVTDVQPDALRGQALYTGTDQQTIAQAYSQPPVCKDACTFYGYTIYAAPSFPHSLNLTFLGVGSPSGVQVGDTITIGGITFTAGNSQNVSTNTFQVVTSGTPAQNITSTVNSFLQVVNQSTTSTVYAYLISGPTDLPGQIQLVVRTPGGPQFAVTASAHGTAYSPNLPTSGTSVSSTSASYPNCVLPSVQNQPEAAPIANLLPPIGSATSPIRRVIPLRDRVAVLKDDGAFFITGTTLQNFVILPIDYTTQIMAPDSAVVLNNEVWALCTTGVVAISDTGVRQESFKNVNDFFTTLFGQAYSTVQQYASAVAYQTDHKYILFVPSAAGSPNNEALVYNVFTNAWTKWLRQQSCGFINPSDGRLYVGNSQTNQVVKERKAIDYTDFVDESAATPTITAIDQTGLIITLSSLNNVNAGDLLYQSSTLASPILSINSVTNQVTVRDSIGWSLASATIYPSIKPYIQWKPQTAMYQQVPTMHGNSGMLRQFSEGEVFFTSARFTNATASFFTDIYPTTQTVGITSSSSTPWGQFIWGGTGVEWGDAIFPKPIRFLVPTNSQVCSQINPSFSSSEAWATWALIGINLVYIDIGEELSA